ncbi:hypothetical protein SLS62_004067 [Diatrype stigma]|uniref:Uncharacterized protein n=1 Tax=Diatrype stigma TaxID=117547 RepID=A0AAN9V5N7_9PEZI
MPGVVLAPESRTQPRGVSIGNYAPNRSHLAGCILWLPERGEDTYNAFDTGDSDDGGHTLDPGCYNHPVVVLSSEAHKGKVVILILTSFNDTDLALRHPYDSRARLAHLPIEPCLPHPDNGRLLTLEDRSLRLRKNSYVKTTRLHTVAYRQLEAYDRRGATFALSRRSYQELVEYAQYPVPLPGITPTPLLQPPPPRRENIYSLSGNGDTAAASPVLPATAWRQSTRPTAHSSATAGLGEKDMAVPWQSLLMWVGLFMLTVPLCLILLYVAFVCMCLKFFFGKLL